MIPISSIGNLDTKSKSLKKKISKKNSNKNFSKLFSISSTSDIETSEKNNSKISQKEINDLISGLNKKSSLLKSHPTLDNYRAYKTTLELILNKIILESYSIIKSTSTKSDHLTKKEYHLVKVVKQELVSLLEMLQANQLENLSIIKQVIKINGLIVDHLA